jgi:hypothetical protein
VGFLPFLNHWWNLPFLVMLGLVGVFFVLQILGIFGHDGDHDADADADADVDADHDHDVDADADGGAGWSEVLAFFGVGHVPFMVIWVTLFIFSGFSGIFFNRVMFVKSGGAYPGWFFAVVLLISFAIGLVGVRLFSRLAGRLVDTGGKGATAKHELAGKLGVVASPQVDQTFGEIRVKDDRGNEILVHGRLAAGEAPCKHGEKVVLVDFDGEKELFWVAACPEAETEQKKG